MSERTANPECSPNRCRACLGYGVVVVGLGWRRCDGEEIEGERLSEAMAGAAAARDALPWWKPRARRAALREYRRIARRYKEVVMAGSRELQRSRDRDTRA